MEMLNNILNCIGIIVIAIGVICIYDARKLTNKFFSVSDTNTATRTFKIIGFIVSIIGSAILIF